MQMGDGKESPWGQERSINSDYSFLYMALDCTPIPDVQSTFISLKLWLSGDAILIKFH